MSTLIVFEKPSVTRAVLPHLPADHNPHDTYVVHMLGTGAAQFDFARAPGELPAIEPLRLKLQMNPTFNAIPITAFRSPTEYGSARSMPVLELWPHIDRVICAVDHTPAGAWAFHSSMSLWTGTDAAAIMYEAWRFDSLDEANVRNALGQQHTTADMRALLAYGLTKRYFEYQWINNSRPLLGAAMRAAGRESAVIPSKFGLQLLYFLREHGPVSYGELLHVFRHWRGTSTYPSTTLGSPTSRDAIIERLQALELLTPMELLGLTATGQNFLDQLHPDCSDQDLPQRLDAWCRAGLESSRQGIDNYIRAYVNKQLAFAGSVYH